LYSLPCYQILGTLHKEIIFKTRKLFLHTLCLGENIDIVYLIIINIWVFNIDHTNILWASSSYILQYPHFSWTNENLCYFPNSTKKYHTPISSFLDFMSFFSYKNSWAFFKRFWFPNTPLSRHLETISSIEYPFFLLVSPISSLKSITSLSHIFHSHVISQTRNRELLAQSPFSTSITGKMAHEVLHTSKDRCVI
jgi:hypothetical protein